MAQMYALLHARMIDDIAKATGYLLDDDTPWAEIAELYLEVVE